MCSTRERLLASWFLDLSHLVGPYGPVGVLPGMAGALDGIQIALGPGERFYAIGREAQGRETLDRALALEHLGCGGPCVHGNCLTSGSVLCQALSQILLRKLAASIEAGLRDGCYTTPETPSTEPRETTLAHRSGRSGHFVVVSTGPRSVALYDAVLGLVKSDVRLAESSVPFSVSGEPLAPCGPVLPGHGSEASLLEDGARDAHLAPGGGSDAADLAVLRQSLHEVTLEVGGIPSDGTLELTHVGLSVEQALRGTQLTHHVVATGSGLDASLGVIDPSLDRSVGAGTARAGALGDLEGTQVGLDGLVGVKSGGLGLGGRLRGGVGCHDGRG